MDVPVRQLGGAEEVAALLDAGERPALLLVRRGSRDPEVLRLLERARELGLPVQLTSDADLRRMSRIAPAGDVLALCGRDPAASAEAVLAEEGAVWLLAGIAYAGNAGYAIRSAEVSGAAGIFLDAHFEPAARKRALRASMHAERFLPVYWREASGVLDAAARAGRRLVAIEDVGRAAPWEVDLTGRVLFAVGGEADGLPSALVERCDAVVRVPMAGFIPSYNLQAAMAVVAVERLRQQAAQADPARALR